MSKIFFLSFYTEGNDIDGCYNLTSKIEEVKNKISNHFDGVFFYNKRDLKNMPNSENICNYFEEELEMNPNANKIGYFDFKPFLIKYVLSQIPENSILIYHDGNFEKNPQYFETDWDNIKKISENLLTDNNSDIFVQIERSGIYVKNHVKTFVVDKFFTDETENYIVKNSPLLNAARIILRNTEFSKKFVDEYLNYCLDKTLLQKNPNPYPDNDFKWSCGDQDILNCLVYRYILDKKLHPDFPKYSFLYRVIRFDNRPFVWPGQSWNPHPTMVSIFENHLIKNYLKK